MLSAHSSSFAPCRGTPGAGIGARCSRHAQEPSGLVPSVSTSRAEPAGPWRRARVRAQAPGARAQLGRGRERSLRYRPGLPITAAALVSKVPRMALRLTGSTLAPEPPRRRRRARRPRARRCSSAGDLRRLPRAVRPGRRARGRPPPLPGAQGAARAAACAAAQAPQRAAAPRRSSCAAAARPRSTCSRRSRASRCCSTTPASPCTSCGASTRAERAVQRGAATRPVRCRTSARNLARARASAAARSRRAPRPPCTRRCRRSHARAKRVAERARPAEGLRLSLCMIVRDEEEMLPRCLAAVAPAVDEIIIVDTGSTDRTIEIARSFGAQRDRARVDRLVLPTPATSRSTPPPATG